VHPSYRTWRISGFTARETDLKRKSDSYQRRYRTGVHFHMPFLNGAYLVSTRAPAFWRLAPPSEQEQEHGNSETSSQ
jgi:hypothetical protein